jgi:hypothetical protein
MSPKSDLVHEFRKQLQPTTFYMPVWSEDELSEIAPDDPAHQQIWRDRYKKLGGIPRVVFGFLDVEPDEILSTPILECEMDDIHKVVGDQGRMNPRTGCIHHLVHMHSEFPYRECSNAFATPYVFDNLVAKFGRECCRRLDELMTSFNGKSLTSQIFGTWYEKFAIKALQKGGEFKYRRLGTERTMDDTLNIPSHPVEYVKEVEASHLPGTLYIPHASNYPAIDAWIPGLGAFQVTVGKTHPINQRILTDLPLLGPSGGKLFFILPRSRYHGFKKQKIENSDAEIEQYAILLNEPNLMDDLEIDNF